jgi:nucleotide-binding universal stress UspA family protein
MPFRRILLAHDLSDTCEQALRVAVELARREGASLTIIHAYAIPSIPLPEGYVIQGPAGVVEIQRSVQLALDGARARAVALGASNVRTEARAGGPADVIVDLARSGRYDLVVMGTHGRRGVARMILGSVAETVVRRASCPVLTVHPGPDVCAVPVPLHEAGV